MRQVPLKELAAGMVLARDVETHDGYRILAKGTLLTSGKIALLDAWNVIEAAVEDAARTEEAAGAGAGRSSRGGALDEARRRLGAKFEGRLDNAWMKALHEEARQRLGVRGYWTRGL